MGCVILSILINILFLTNLEYAEAGQTPLGQKAQFKKLFKQFINKYQLLITPFSMWDGLIHGFAMADFTQVSRLYSVHFRF